MRKRRFSLPTIIVIIIAAGIFLYSGCSLAMYLLDAYKNKDSVNTLAEIAVTEQKNDTIQGTSKYHAVQEQEEDAPNTTPSVAEKTEEEIVLPITVDFELLQKENPEIIGWIYSEGTQINYPVLQAEDNDKYLHTLTDGRYASGGSIFMDCDAKPDLSEFNTVIYGHNMKTGAMFGTIDLYKKQQYYDEHKRLFYYTPDNIYLAEPVAGIVTNTESTLYRKAVNKEAKEEFLSYITEYSTFKSDAVPDLRSRYIVLSTCSYEYDDARYLLICRLTRLEQDK